ncbi:MAG TPA: ABC transporter permease subunit, partial [Planctomycetota bacterium]|nr:ABC transporter permease subunit [Planctomycetota bacterium]
MRVLDIGRNTFRQAMHLPVLHVLILGSVVLLAIVGQLPRFTLVVLDDIKMLKDLAITTATLCGLLVTIFVAVNTVTAELENWTVVTLLSKPVTRAEFVTGKFVGLAMTLAAVFGVLTVLYILMVWWGMLTSIYDYRN